MSRAPEGPLEQLERLRQGYASTLADRVGELRETCVRLQNHWNPEDRDIASRLAHKLSGSGEAFGFGKMGAAARDLEEFLSLISGRNHSASSPVPAAAVRAQLVELADAVVEGAARPDAPRVAEHQVADVSPMADWTERTAPVVCLVDDDPDALRQMALQIGFFGYRVVSSTSILALDELVEAHQPAALVVDVGFPEGATAGPLKIAEFRQMRKGDLPVIFISAQTDFESRLAAARAGAAGYFGKPAAVGALVELLDQLCGRQTRDPYRILIVDDEEDVGRYHALSLGRSGFHSEVITDPSSLIPTLEEFRPDLILMDLHLPGCSGIELSAMIRQDFRFATVPIVFLSAETDVDRQFAALSRGADDFLVKPIPPAKLVAAMVSRCERARILSARMTHDGLTGLLSHTAVSERLEAELAALRRKRDPGAALIFAMLDVDHFKRINDTHGHAAGDLVLKTLGRFFRQHARKMDVIGRCGGEEFALIMPATDESGGLQALERIRDGFSQIRHQVGEQAFTATLSGGGTVADGSRTAGEVRAAADSALYEAKRAGRNRVVLASQGAPMLR